MGIYSLFTDYRKTPNKRPPPINAPPYTPDNFMGYFGYTSAENGPIFIP